MAASSASENVISESRQSSPVVTDLGLTRIDRIPKDASVKVVADIVFVHGLQGHPRTTWETKTHTKAHKSLRERMRNVIPGWTKQDHAKQDYEVQGDTKVFWPADLLPDDHKDIRILTYGYDSKVTKGFIAPSSKNNIFQHGESLLNAICRSRTGCSDRPIIFVAHSLGGLLVKQALIEAQKQKKTPSSQALYAHTYAIIFFGTPHRGSDMASWGLVLSNITKAVQIDTNKAILRDLDPSSGSSKLQELRKDFDDILHDRNHGNGTNMLRIYTFQEEQGMTGVSGLRSKVIMQATQ